MRETPLINCDLKWLIYSVECTVCNYRHLNAVLVYMYLFVVMLYVLLVKTLNSFGMLLLTFTFYFVIIVLI